MYTTSTTGSKFCTTIHLKKHHSVYIYHQSVFYQGQAAADVGYGRRADTHRLELANRARDLGQSTVYYIVITMYVDSVYAVLNECNTHVFLLC